MSARSLVVHAALLVSLVCFLSASSDAEDEDAKRRREKAAEAAGVSRLEVGRALKRGAAFLTTKYKDGFDERFWNSTLELVMLTLTHAGVDESDPVYRKGLKALETCKLQYTYRVAALAMALARIDRRRYRGRIAHCAQWLVDTQLQEGEWGYPRTLSSPRAIPRPVKVPAPKGVDEEERSPGDRYERPSVKIRRKRHKHIDIKGVGDISNTQFAILGLQA